MRILLTSMIFFSFLNTTVNACNLNLPREKLIGKAKTPYKNQILDKSLGSTIAYHHIIPRIGLEEILYTTFDEVDFAQVPEARQFFKKLINQLTYTNPGVEFKDYQSRDKAIEILNNLSLGNINNKFIDGKGEQCLNKNEQKTLQNYLSYAPIDGFFGPFPLMDDPGNNFDTYSKYFMDKSIYLAFQNLYANKKLKNKASNLKILNLISSYQIAEFNINLWGKLGNNKFACLVNNYYSECLER